MSRLHLTVQRVLRHHATGRTRSDRTTGRPAVTFTESSGQVCTASCRATAHRHRVRAQTLTYNGGRPW